MIRGTTHDQDARFCDKTKKMIEKSEWPDKYDIKIDLTKVDLQLIKIWIEKRLVLLLGEEDDIISGTIISIIDESVEKEQKLNAKVFHVAISGFLLEKTLTFVSQLWDLLDQAQRSSRGIPQSLLQEKLKGEEEQRKKLEELNAKRYKINNHKFNNVVKRFTNNRNSPPNRERSQRGEKQHKKRKDRSRSRSTDRKKKHRHSEEKRKHRSRSRDGEGKQKKSKDYERQAKNRKHRRSESSDSSKPKKSHRPRKQSPSPKSDSSGVVSSSNSNDN